MFLRVKLQILKYGIYEMIYKMNIYRMILVKYVYVQSWSSVNCTDIYILVYILVRTEGREKSIGGQLVTRVQNRIHDIT